MALLKIENSIRSMAESLVQFVSKYRATFSVSLIIVAVAILILGRKTELFVFPFNEMVWGNVADWVAAISTVATALAALYALFSWKNQKQYDLKIKALSMGRRAKGYIQAVRSPFVFQNNLHDEIKPFFKKSLNSNELEESDAWIFYSYLSRRKNWDQLLNQISLLREDIWATFGSDSVFTRYYDLIIQTDVDVWNAYNAYVMIKKNKDDDNNDREITKLRTIMFDGGPKDQIAMKLNEVFEELEKQRGKS